MLSKDAAYELIKKIGSQTRFFAEIWLESFDNGITRFANSEISQHVSVSNTNVKLTLYNKRKEASYVTNVISDDESLRKLVQTAEELLKFAPNSNFEAFNNQKPQTPARENEINERLADAFGINERVAHIKAGVDALESGFTAAGALGLYRTTVAAGNNGNDFRYGAFNSVCFNTVITHESGAAGSAECGSFDNEPNIAAAFSKAEKTARQAIGPIEIKLGAYTVVLSPLALSDLMDFVVVSHNAKQVIDGNSYAFGKMGEKLFGANISLKDDVHHSGTCPLYFDYEGSVRKQVDLISNGVVKALLYDRKNAIQHNTVSTGHATGNKGDGGFGQNLVMKGGNQTLDEIIARTPNGIFINEFHYTNFVNPRALQVTGLTRNGTFLIENGKLTQPIKTLRFTQSLIEALNKVTALSVERAKIVSPCGVNFFPGARIEDFCFTGIQ